MKKLFAMLMIAALLCLCACGNAPPEAPGGTSAALPDYDRGDDRTLDDIVLAFEEAGLELTDFDVPFFSLVGAVNGTIFHAGGAKATVYEFASVVMLARAFAAYKPGEGEEEREWVVNGRFAIDTQDNRLRSFFAAIPGGVSAPAGTSHPAQLTTRHDMELNAEIERDGLTLRVNSAYDTMIAGEAFTLTASITNSNDHDIVYGVGSGTPNMNLEIPVHIAPGFVDMDTHGQVMTTDYVYATLKAGETHTQTMRFWPGSEPDDAYPAGEYQGAAVFVYYTGTVDNPGDMARLELEFPVKLI